MSSSSSDENYKECIDYDIVAIAAPQVQVSLPSTEETLFNPTTAKKARVDDHYCMSDHDKELISDFYPPLYGTGSRLNCHSRSNHHQLQYRHLYTDHHYHFDDGDEYDGGDDNEYFDDTGLEIVGPGGVPDREDYSNDIYGQAMTYGARIVCVGTVKEADRSKVESYGNQTLFEDSSITLQQYLMILQEHRVRFKNGDNESLAMVWRIYVVLHLILTFVFPVSTDRCNTIIA